MDYTKVLKGILDLGEAMINSGAEIGRVEDSLYRLCDAYGFKKKKLLGDFVQHTGDGGDPERGNADADSSRPGGRDEFRPSGLSEQSVPFHL